jgi:hypothetical protein
MVKIAFSFLVLCFALIRPAGAVDYKYFYSPGVKFGIAFGKNACPVLGIEMSAGKIMDFGLMGFVFGASHLFNGTRNICPYAECEYSAIFIGGSLGVAYDSYLKDADPYLRTFVGYGVYLSYRYAFGKLPNELSFVGKLPLYPILLDYDNFMTQMK